MIKLKPCPFCGGEAYEKSDRMYGDTSIPYTIVCSKCGYSISELISPYDPEAQKKRDAFYKRWERGRG